MVEDFFANRGPEARVEGGKRVVMRLKILFVIDFRSEIFRAQIDAFEVTKMVTAANVATANSGLVTLVIRAGHIGHFGNLSLTIPIYFR